MRAQFDDRPALERIAVDPAPPLAAGERVRGGAGVIEAQSECPFRAVAKHRLRVEPWERAPAGLAPWERGQLLHAALAAFWRDLGSHAALTALTCEEVDERIARAVDEAIAKLDAPRARALPPLVRASEPERLARLIREWIDACENPRPPFTVRAVETKTDLAVGGFTLALRIDRIDALDDGGAAIVDYKSGEVAKLARWFDPRPRATQLALYALALRAAEPDTPLRAVAFGSVAPGEIRACGLAADASAWPALTAVENLPPAAPHDWTALGAWWNDAIGALARAFAAGEAAVDPRDADVCGRCGLQPLCRVDEAPGANDANGDG
jgi:RecB family exonuclease